MKEQLPLIVSSGITVTMIVAVVILAVQVHWAFGLLLLLIDYEVTATKKK